MSLTCNAFKMTYECYMKCTFATKTPITAVANSGPDDPAAINVAPAISGGIFNTEMESYGNI